MTPTQELFERARAARDRAASAAARCDHLILASRSLIDRSRATLWRRYGDTKFPQRPSLEQLSHVDWMRSLRFAASASGRCLGGLTAQDELVLRKMAARLERVARTEGMKAAAHVHDELLQILSRQDSPVLH